MAGTAAKPFDFDELGAASAMPERTYSAAEMEQAQQEARDTAINQLVARKAEAQTRLLERILSQLNTDRKIFTDALNAHRTAMSQTAEKVLEKFCAGLNANRETEIALRLLNTYLAAAPDQAPAAIVLSKKTNTPAISKLKKAVSANGGNKFMTVETSPDIEPGDCRIEWRQGALSYDLEKTLRQIHEIFSSAPENRKKTKTRKATSP